MFLLILAPVVLLLGITLFFYLRRTARFWKLKKPLLQILPPVGTILLLLPLFWFSSVAALAVLHLFFFVLLTQLLHLALRRLRVWQKIYGSGLLPVVLTALLLLFGFFHMRDIHRTYYRIETDKLDSDLRIVFVSDLHYPNAMSPERLQTYCDEIAAQSPDLLLLGGDIVDESTTYDELQTCFRLLSSIQSTHGIYYIYGNHDRAFYSNAANFTPSDLKAALLENHINILSDSSADVGNLTIIGREDYSVRNRLSSQALLSGIDTSRFILLLDHQPRDCEENAALGCDLMLSGHTHNGQIWPIGYINRMIGPTYGEYTFGEMKAIVSSGIVGWAYPIRTQGVSEYVVIDLHATG